MARSLITLLPWWVVRIFFWARNCGISICVYTVVRREGSPPLEGRGFRIAQVHAAQFSPARHRWMAEIAPSRGAEIPSRSIVFDIADGDGNVGIFNNCAGPLSLVGLEGSPEATGSPILGIAGGGAVNLSTVMARMTSPPPFGAIMRRY